MNAQELLAYLHQQGIDIWLNGDKLLYRGPKRTLQPALMTLLKKYKSELRRLLKDLSQGQAKQFALSYAQKTFWFLYESNPTSTAYLVSVAVRLHGKVSTSAMSTAVKQLGMRHQALRTQIVVEDGVPWQRIEPATSVSLQVIDVADWTEDRFKERLQEEAHRPFDLVTEPPARFHLYQRSAQDFVLFLSMHHIHVDGWSMGILIRELALLYRDASTGQTTPLAVIPATYFDFVLWQQQLVLSSDGDAHIHYWQGVLAGELPTLDLPTDRPRPLVRSERGASTAAFLTPELFQEIKNLATQEGTTPYVILLAAFATLLFRYSGQADIVVASPFHGRSEFRFNNIVGCFINSITLRCNGHPEQTFRSFLADVHRQSREALSHADYPFPVIVERLRPERDPGRTSIFQVMFTYENFYGADTLSSSQARPSEQPGSDALFGIPMTSYPLVQQEGQVDLNLMIMESDGGLSCWWSYNTDLFDESTVHRMGRNFGQLLQAAVANPEERLSALPILDSAERHRLLVEWNDTGVEYPKDKCIHELFEAQVEQTPEAVAVVFAAEQLTYRELNRRANQLAYQLQSMGVGPDVLVVLCVERSLEMIIGLLGILKAGGAYLPIDPDAPRDRIAFMIKDAQPAVILSTSALLPALPATPTPVLCFESLPNSCAPGKDGTPIAQVRSSNLIYALYTSGSTGRPKGVLNTHGGIVNRILWMQAQYGMRPADRVLQKTPYTFDVSGWEFYWPLLVGARLVFAKPGGHRDPLYLKKLIAEAGITHLHFVPSMLGPFLDQEEIGGACRSVRQVFCSGEALGVAQARLFAERLPDAELHNLYGPTEAAIDVSFFACKRAVDLPSIPIGRPIANTQLFILDAHLQPVPIGVRGEIYIAGVGLARGYLNRPELTAQKFIPNPFSTAKGARMYKTGDLARFLPDGNIEFLGRIDSQIKLRGFRIELGEIEVVLRSHSAVQDCAVIVREVQPGEQRLVAYLVLRSDESSAPGALSDFLRRILPDYMIPTNFVVLKALPLTSSGKLDRRALPAPTPDSLGMSASQRMGGTPPKDSSKSPIHDLLRDIWTTVLAVPNVSIDDNFFALGGHSLLATQVISRVRTAFRVDLPIAALFATPTIAGLALEITAALSGAHTTALLPAITKCQDVTDLPLSFAQKRLWFLHQLASETPLYYIPHAVYLKGNLDTKILKRSLLAITMRHTVLRTRIANVDGAPVQRVIEPWDFSLPITDLRTLPLSERHAVAERRAAADAQAPFDLSAGPLLRGRLYQTGDSEYLLLLGFHHILMDGWSLKLLWCELQSFYSAFCAGQATTLPELPIQYSDFAVAQRQWMTGDYLARQVQFWRRQLDGLASPLELPTDRPHPAVEGFAGAYYSFAVGSELSTSFRELCRREGVTLFMGLLAVFQILLYRYSGQPGFAIGTPIAGRNRVETESLIGCFVNTLVLRASLSQELTFRELLEQVRERSLAAFANQDVPFELVVDALNPPRDAARSPLFQVMFILQNTVPVVDKLFDLEVKPCRVGTRTAKFELTLVFEETSDGLQGVFEYNTDLFDADTIERMARHYVQFLKCLIVTPDLPLSALPVLTPEEYHRIVVTWNQTAISYPAQKCIHQHFAEQAMQAQDAPAVFHQGQILTYRDLDQRANQLANYLRILGIRTGSRVGICMERSVDLITGILGILKAGGTYVPVDPRYPKDRIAFILTESAAVAIVTQEQLQSVLLLLGLPLIRMDADQQTLSKCSKLPPESGALPEHTAYILFTSGSTGRPKGVQICHRTVMSLWAALKSACYADLAPAGLRVALNASLTFDVSVGQIIQLLSGHTLYIIPDAVRRNGSALVGYLRQHQIQVLDCTPTQLGLLIDSGLLEQESSWGCRLLVAGEAFPSHLWQRMQRAEHFTCFNLYGPTECTVYNTFTDLRTAKSSPDIGRPLGNNQTYVLDSQRKPLPVGVAGEIYLGGEQVGQGYLNAPELTAERFLPDPFRESALARMYRTGDLGKYASDGSIEFLGRSDHQVKLRGYRIELGEIEAPLRSRADIQDCVVILREDRPLDKRLVAYLVSRRPVSPTHNELHEHLRRHLPDYMLPSHYVVLPQLPLTGSGKLDRKALPVPGSTDFLPDGIKPPRDTVELELVRIWEDLLATRPIGIGDNFFDRGGNSLLAVRLFTEIQERLGRRLPLAILFQEGTVESLARLLRQQKAPVAESAVVPLRAKGEHPPLFCIHPAGGQILCYWELVQRLKPAQPVYAIQDPVLQDPPPTLPVASIEEMAAKYLQAVRAVQPQGPYFLCGWSFGGLVAFEMAQQLLRSGLEVALLALLDSRTPEQMSLAGPLDDENLLQWFLIDLYARLSKTNPPQLAPGSPLRESLSSVLQHFQRSSLLPGSMLERQMASLFELYRHHISLVRTYRPERLPGRVVLVRAEDAPKAEGAELMLGWDRYCAQSPLIHSVPANHFTMLAHPHVQRVAEILEGYLPELR